MNVIINFSKRWLYTFIVIGILTIICVGVYALIPGVAPDPGHLIDNVAPPSGCGDGQVLQFVDESTGWGCVDISAGGGITEEVDPTVPGWAKGNLCVCVQCENRYGQMDSAKCARIGSWTGLAGAIKYPLYYCRIRLYTC